MESGEGIVTPKKAPFSLDMARQSPHESSSWAAWDKRGCIASGGRRVAARRLTPGVGQASSAAPRVWMVGTQRTLAVFQDVLEQSDGLIVTSGGVVAIGPTAAPAQGNQVVVAENLPTDGDVLLEQRQRFIETFGSAAGVSQLMPDADGFDMPTAKPAIAGGKV